jgi:hypothetical protein
LSEEIEETEETEEIDFLTPRLRKCPICDGKASFSPNQIDFEDVWGVSCDDCGLLLDSCMETKEEAFEEWNKRAYDAPMAALHKQISELKRDQARLQGLVAERDQKIKFSNREAPWTTYERLKKIADKKAAQDILDRETLINNKINRVLSQKVQDLPLSTRFTNGLYNAGLTCLGDYYVRDMTPTDLSMLPNVGRKGVREFLDYLKEQGLPNSLRDGDTYSVKVWIKRHA